MSHVVVIKVGTSSLVDPVTRQTQVSAIARVAETATRLISLGFKVIIVSSGAVGLGVTRLGLKERPTSIAGKQAAAAVGQVRLMNLYDDVFSVLGHRVAQVLLTYETFGERTQYLNARNTFLELLRLGAIPIVNENDTVAVQEIRVGDNDTLSALVSAMVGAQWLFLLTDVEALYTSNPKDDAAAAPLRLVHTHDIQSLRRQMAAGVPRLCPGAPIVDPTTTTAPVSTTAASAAASVTPVSASAGSSRSTSPSTPSAAATPTAAASGSKSKGLPRAGSSGGLSSGAPSSSTPGGGGSGGSGGAGSAFGTGGMATKLKAAALATAAGTTVVIMNTQRIDALQSTLASVAPGTASGAAAGPSAATATSASASTSASTAAEHGLLSPGTAALNTIEETEQLTPAQRAQQCLAFADRGLGSTFLPAPRPVTGRKRWLLSLAPGGTLVLDAGACAAVTEHRKSLFPAGVLRVEGDFEAQDAVQLVSEDGIEVARALVNYSADDCRKLRGHKSKETAELLGYLGAETLADRDNIVVLVASGAYGPRGAGGAAAAAAPPAAAAAPARAAAAATSDA